MKELTTKEALEVKKSLEVLADFLEIESTTVASNVCFLDEKRWDKMKKASLLWNEFQDSDIVKRGKLLGIEIIKN